MPPTYKISHWLGRLGNSIQQVLYGILAAKREGGSFISAPHPIINKIEYNPNPDNLPVVEGHFFDWGKVESYRKEWSREIALNYIAPALNIPPFNNPLPEDVLVIHIRGGDIFYPGGSCACYIQNPLSFYTRLVDKYPHVILVSEDTANPVVNELRKRKNVHFVSSTVENDFSLLMRAQSLATSGVGTFGIAAALCSPNIKNLHVSNIFEVGHINPTFLFNKGLNIEMSFIDSSYLPTGKWFALPWQKERILTYNTPIFVKNCK